MKAILQAEGKHIPRVHNLIELMLLCSQVDPTFELLRSDLVVMERYAVRVRYPGNSAEKDDAQIAYKTAKVVKAFVREKLALK